MPVDLKNKPGEDSKIDPPWYRRGSDPLEEAYGAPSATDDSLPTGHPSRSDSSGLSGEGLAAAEEGAGSGDTSTGADTAEKNQVGGFYKGKGGRSGGIKQNLGKVLSSKKGKLAAGGLGGGLVGIIMLIISILPLKVMHMVDNLQMRFFAGTEQAAEDMGEHLLRSYIVEKVMPGMTGNRSCTSTLTNRNCVSRSPDDTPIDLLYNSWRDSRMEQKLAEKGIVIEKRGRSGKNFVLITPSTLSQGGIDLGEFDPDQPGLMNSSLAERMNERQVKREVRNALNDETRLMRAVYRYKFGRFVERKYGITRCLGACNTKFAQTIKEKVADKKLAWKLAFIDRIVVPRNELYGTAMACALDGFRCSETPSEADENGMRESEFEESSRNSLQNRNSGGRTVSDPELKSLLDEFNTKGIGNAVLEEVVGKIAAKGATTGVPIAGQVIASVEVFNGLRAAGPAAKHLNYVVNSQAMATTYMMYRSHADEYRAGKVDSTIAASVGASLGSNNGTDQNGGPAESSPFYNDAVGGEKNTAALSSPLTVTASAAAGYPCNTEGETITKGVCSELNLSKSNGIVDAAGDISALLDSPLFIQAQLSSAVLTPVIEIADSALSWAIDALPIEQLPGYDTLVKYSAKFTQAFAKWFATRLINDAIGESPSGGRMVDLAAGGADVTANTFNQHMLGAGAISDSAAAQIREERELERRKEFEQLPLMARIFDTSSSYSLISRAATTLPSDGLGNLPQLSFSSLMNPFGTTASTFKQSFAGATSTASAATPRNLNVFGVTQYGYAKNDPVFTTSPKTYWESNNCSDPDNKKKWGEQGEVNPDTGIPENRQSNGCMLLESIATSSCAYVNDQCLTPEEIGDDVSSGDGDGSGFGLRAASFNILHSPDGDVSARLRKSIDTLLHPPKEGGQVDVVGLQEVRKDQLTMLKSSEFGNQYDMFPNTTNSREYEPNIVAWKKGKYKLIKEGFFDNGIRYFHGNPEQMPVVKLEDTASGEQFYFASIHNPRSGNGRGENATIRDDNSRKFEEYFARLKQQEPDTAMILVGDFNAGYQAAEDLNDIEVGRRSFCILTRGIFWDAWHASKDIDEKCPKRSTVSFIDHIFVDRGTKVGKFFVAARGHDKNGSDHPTIFADIQVGETESGGGSDGWSWPLRQKINNGPCYGGPREHAGMDMNSEIADNPVYAMHSGKVVRKGYDEAAGNYVTIKADEEFQGKPVFYSYEHLKPGSVRIDLGDKIGGGDIVAIAGTSGSVDLGASLAHLHIVTATTNTLGAYGSLGTTFNPLDILKDAGPPPEGYQCENR